MFAYLVVFLFTLFVVHYTKKLLYWRRKGINGPIPLPVLGISYEFFTQPITTLHTVLEKKYGQVYGLHMGTLPLLNVSDPEIVKAIVQKDSQNFLDISVMKFKQKFFKDSFMLKSGQEWRDGRNLITPVFTTRRIKDIYPQIQKASKPFFENIEGLIEEGKDIDVRDLLKGWSLDVIAKFVFAIEINSSKEKDHPLVVAVRKLLNFNNNFLFSLIFLLPQKVVDLLNIQFLDAKSLDYIGDVTKALAKQRRENKEQQWNDFLDLLLHTVDEKELKNVTQDQIAAYCILFFFAALESVSMAISNALYLLMLHPEIQEKLYEDLIDQYPDKEISYERLNDSKFLDAVVKESQRVHPGVNQLIRIAENEITIKGVKIDRGQAVSINVWNLHFNEQFWRDAEKFEPERWLDEELRPEGENFIYFLPFGSGPRSCVAMRMALVQVKYCLAKIIMNYQVYRTDKTSVPPKYLKNQAALTYKELILGFRKRES